MMLPFAIRWSEVYQVHVHGCQKYERLSFYDGNKQKESNLTQRLGNPLMFFFRSSVTPWRSRAQGSKDLQKHNSHFCGEKKSLCVFLCIGFRNYFFF